MNFSDIKDILLSDFSITRSQIRASEEWHVKVSLIYTLSIATASIALIAIDPQKVIINKSWIFGFINLIIIAQFSFLLNYHFFYLQLWANYVQLIEEKIKILCEDANLVEFETIIAPIYFYHKGGATQKSPNKLLILLIHLPSLLIYLYGTYKFSSQFILLWYNVVSYAFFIIMITVLIKFYIVNFKAQGELIKNIKKQSIDSFVIWLKDKHVL